MAKRGRPRVKNPRSKVLSIALSEEEFARLDESSGLAAVSVWARELIFEGIELRRLAKSETGASNVLLEVLSARLAQEFAEAGESFAWSFEPHPKEEFLERVREMKKKVSG